MMSDEVKKDDEPRFLKAPEPDTWQKPDDVDTWGDWFLHPDRPLMNRHRELCRLAAHGKTNKYIAEKLNYSETRVSVLMGNTRIQKEIAIYRDKLFQADTQTRLKELAPDALNVMEGILTSETMSVREKENAAKWVLEKTSGKPAQQIDVSGEVKIGSLLDKLDQITAKEKTINAEYRDLDDGEMAQLPEGEAESHETAPDDQDEFSQWLDKNMEKS